MVMLTADNNVERLLLQAGVDLLRVGTRPPAASRASAYDFSAACRFESRTRSFPSSQIDIHLLYKTSNIVGEPSVRGIQTPLAAPLVSRKVSLLSHLHTLDSTMPHVQIGSHCCNLSSLRCYSKRSGTTGRITPYAPGSSDIHRQQPTSLHSRTEHSSLTTELLLRKFAPRLAVACQSSGRILAW